MSRFFVNQSDIDNNLIKISGEDVNHITRVLRLKIGESITVCDSLGVQYNSLIKEFHKDSVLADIQSVVDTTTECSVKVTLYQGLPKSDKMDLIIQKSVELGVFRVVPVITERTIVKVDNTKDISKKVLRWQRLSMEAAKQSNRCIIPCVESPISFKEAILSIKDISYGIIPYEKESGSYLKEILNDYRGRNLEIAVFIGPEGGFTEEEISMAKEYGVKTVTLGPRILRTETAGMAAISIIMYELGDVGECRT